MRRLVRRMVARVADQLPADAERSLLRLRSRVGDGPIIVPAPGYDSVLVLAPHPDDETVACGGLIALLADRGCRVHVVVVSDGASTAGRYGPGELRRRRRAETEAAVQVLGAAEVTFLDHPDGGLADRQEQVTADLQRLLGSERPQAVVVPWVGDGHPDHRAVAEALAAAELGSTDVWCAETWTPLPATHLVDITAVLDRKREAIACHTTAQHAMDLEAFLGLNRFRSLHGLRGQGAAEAFLVAGVDGFRRTLEIWGA